MSSDMRVHFELLAQPDRVEGIAQLLLRRNRLTPSVLVLCPDAGFAAQLDERLWTIHPESFLAHAVACDDSKLNARQPILLATSTVRDNQPAVLINGGLEVPPDISGFAHLVDFVDGWDEGLKQAARERFRTYRQMGLDPRYLGSK
ncbi:MAG: DNA polymerase III subunit chi [Zetaproteobacteria bacterium CG12_big_fil_rev_8_21_14_0_65_54_13]|nr:MAG: DNA polymerase III subunit chi [Zetaproteobacteria bacterium CG23_combo_of_CG06-09_8_20_14_all_54_7]PIW46782.1 MAG: DNA polymerase III subunit chi [Zetaproteobacteria bacterium CG12_big_fil_rev_8_21_14_0_65_54_13]PIX54953.1 MAG: DNA polymerase III subunit chi [Zetaproteobacteria bacterium CG_4_10_14_3_um_filter_54_28]PJA27528.1 MAG: DNA polymerase III subunit chi [Zetaproteobacteria bacterium CG_4_9_14_3_um_filter_54_145]